MARKVAVLAHCLLNPATVVRGREGNDGLRRRCLSLLVERDVSLLQLPCPEYMTLGARRWAQSKDQYDVPVFRHRCRELLAPVLEQMAEHMAAGDRIVAVLGSEGSPTCAVSTVTRAPWGGLPPCAGGPPPAPPRKSEESGVFMEILADAVARLGCNLAFLGLPGSGASAEEGEDFLGTLSELCSEADERIAGRKPS